MGLTSSKIKKQERGVPEDRKEYDSWRVPIFAQLPEGRGQDAFLCYLESLGDGCRQYVDSYNFWLDSSKFDLEKIHETYVMDSDRQILGVTPEISRDFSKGAKAMKDLKKHVESDLENKFMDFKVDLQKKYENSFKK